MPETRGLIWFRRAALVATLLCAVVVVVGAWVRLTNAGLGCPDWPGCYGHLHPAQAVERAAEISAANPGRPFDYQKAINEMVHRYIVGALGLLVIGLAVFSVVNRRDPAQPRVLPWFLVALLIVPKVLAILVLFLRKEQHRYGGGPRLIASALLEFTMSTLYAPIRMVFHTRYVIAILSGRHGGWHSPPRGDAGTPWLEALRRHGLHAAAALVWFLAVMESEAGHAWWLLPLVTGLLLAAPLSVFGSRTSVGRWMRERGLLLIPEERWAPEVLRQVRKHLSRVQRLPSFARALFEPSVNVLLRSTSSRSASSWGMKAARAHDRVYAALGSELPKAERLRLLNDPYALALLYRLVSTAPTPPQQEMLAAG